jgi:hypothetical protein
VRSDADVQVQVIAGKDASRNIVQVDERGAVLLRKGANHAPRRLLRAEVHPGAAV